MLSTVFNLKLKRPSVARPSRGLVVAAILGSLWIGHGASAQTTDPFASLGAVSVPEAVTVSQSNSVATPTTYVAYVVTLSNLSSRQLTTISITGTVGVTGSLTAPVIKSIGLQGCPATPTPTSSCTASTFSRTYDTLAPGAILTFPVIVAVPNYSSATPVGGEAINLSYEATFKNGNTSSSSPSSYGHLTNTKTTPVEALSLISMKSVVIKGGGTFFTAENGISTSMAPLTTTVVVPPLTEGDFEEVILNREDNGQVCTNFKKCFASNVSIPGTFSPYLTVVLRQDASNIKPGTKIESVLIRYTSADFDRYLDLCGSETSPNEDLKYGLPCIAKRVHYKSNKVLGWTRELDGDFEWILINHKNGRYGTE